MERNIVGCKKLNKKQSMHVSWLMSSRDIVWHHLHRKVMKIMDTLQFGSQFYSCASSDEMCDAKAAADKEWTKFESIPAWDLGKPKQKGGHSGSIERQKRKSILIH